MMLNNQQYVCNKDDCVGCNACVLVCPKRCISVIDEPFTESRVKDMSVCISCGRCASVCPQLAMPEGLLSKNCFVAWSLNKQTRTESASGGIASELYQSFAREGSAFVGVKQTETFDAKYFLSDHPNDTYSFRNSKYVFSDTSDIYEQVKHALALQKRVLFIGLPCHVAGLKKYLTQMNVDTCNLFLVDLICHGTCPTILLRDHIKAIEKKYKKKAIKLLFRNPKYGTNKYVLTIEDEDGIFYRMPVSRNDAYQVGYHKGIILRENCYQCHYATKQRQGDITLSDFSGLGKLKDFSYDKSNVSCVLINTEKGQKLIQMISESIYVEERPINEAWNYETQLSRPTALTDQHYRFVSEYKKTNNFDYAVRRTMWKQLMGNELQYIFRLREVKKAIRNILPDRLIRRIKRSDTR